MAVVTINEGTTAAFDVSFTDEADAAVTPNIIAWSLFDDRGTVINSREDVAAAPDSTITIVLFGDDLKRTSATDRGIRKLTVYAEYDSDLGSDLPITAEHEFRVADFIGI
jgi:hypothetical protein